MIKLYRQPEQGEAFVIGADPAEGGDNSAFVVVSRTYPEVVMTSKSKEESSQLGYTLNSIGLWLKEKSGSFPVIAVERNSGSATIYVLKQLNYPRIFKTLKSFVSSTDKKSEDYGWSTNTATRPKMLDDLALAVRTRQINIPCSDLIDEMFTFIRNEKTGKPEAESRAHDDLVMSLAIAWQVRQIEPRSSNNTTLYVQARNKKVKSRFVLQ